VCYVADLPAYRSASFALHGEASVGCQVRPFFSGKRICWCSPSFSQRHPRTSRQVPESICFTSR